MSSPESHLSELARHRNPMRKITATTVVALYACFASAASMSSELASSQRWKIADDGGITWNVTPDDIHEDFIEMSGQRIAFLIRYGLTKDGAFTVSHSAVWPMLRFDPNLTESHLRVAFGEDATFNKDVRFGPGLSMGTMAFSPGTSSPGIYVHINGWWVPVVNRALRRVHHSKGIAQFEGELGSDTWTWNGTSKLSFRRSIFPSPDKPLAIDTTTLTNTSEGDIELAVNELTRTFKTPAQSGLYGAYIATERVIGAGVRTLRPGESTTVTVVFEAHKESDPDPVIDAAMEEQARKSRVQAVTEKLQLVTPNTVLNTAFAFAKLRTTESIFQTKIGPLHSPGGGTGFYAAIWANDQAEYANPFFGMLGDPTATEAAINSFLLFARFMNPEYQPVPSSIVGEGENIWTGAGDRGDAAMIAYGAARFALAHGDRQVGEKLWPMIEWSLEYLRRKVTSQGVVASDSDELEERFPSGDANLSTSSLYYDALRSAAMLGRELGKSSAQLQDYAARAMAVRVAVESYFGANVEGFETYRYYDKSDLLTDPKFAAYADRPDVLRAWIAIPLTMEIFDRKSGTIDALFSPRLWTVDGLASEAGQATFWDRATLYALRGVLAAGDMKRGMDYLTSYSTRRLLGDHVPYPIEAYPDGNRAQLAAESALYCRIFTEGLFGIRPTGLHSFTVTPQLPIGWPSMALKNVHAFGGVFDLEIAKKGSQSLTIGVTQDGRRKKMYTIERGTTFSIDVR